MALVVKDRVQETSTTTGTGSLTLLGAVTGFQTFSSAIGNTNTTYYTIQGGAEWEVGIGTVSAGALSRDTVLESSNGGSLVDFSAGSKFVFCTYPAEKSVYYDASNNVNIDINGNAATVTNGLYTTNIGSTVQAYDADTTKNDVANTFTANQVISVTDNTNAALRITQLGTGNALVVEDSANPDSTPFVINANGNVGIGTSSPGEKLQVNGNIKQVGSSAVIYQTDNTNTVFSGLNPVGISNSFGVSTAQSIPYIIANANTERMRIDSSGNVGIGTSSPLGKLKITVGDVAPASSGNMNTGVIYEVDSASRAINFGVNNTAEYSWINSAFSNNSQVAVPLVLMTGATERMRIAANGDLHFNSGYGSVATAYGCRAWVNFNGTGTVAIRASGNVSSITDNGTGKYTVNFTTSMPDANYSALASASKDDATDDGNLDIVLGTTTKTLTVSSCPITIARAGTTRDTALITFAVFR